MKVVKVYSSRLSAQQNAAFAMFENLTGVEPMYLNELNFGRMSASEVFRQNQEWFMDVANSVMAIKFPDKPCEVANEG